ncbi:MAG TPA: alanine dehydrogenase [Usitatibacteraceae bacterium]|nr:alanine dehydrogenase [Usitatibacteraceae bacterium]
MKIGIPREIKDGERRVALVPDAVRALCAAGHALVVEHDAGAGAGFADDEYLAAGASLAESAPAAFDADLVVKVKELQNGEWPHLRNGGMVMGFLLLAGHRNVAHEMLARRITGIAYETIDHPLHHFPVLSPMSRISGELAVTIGAHWLMAPQGGRGIALSGARVVVLGAGNAGAAAALTAQSLGASVTVLSRVGVRLASLAQRFGLEGRTAAISLEALDDALSGADLVIGAVHVAGQPTPKLVTRDHLRSMGSGAVLVDISIDGGGVAESSRPTSMSEPTYVDGGVIHYCVPNIPAAVPRSASLMLSAAVLPYVESLAARGLTEALRDDPGFAAGLQIHGGQVTHGATAQALGRPHVDIDTLLHAC